MDHNTMEPTNKTSNKCILIKPKPITNKKRNLNKDTSLHIKPETNDSGDPTPDHLSEQTSTNTNTPVSNTVWLTRFTPKLPKISCFPIQQGKRHKMERERSDMIQVGQERGPTWLNEKSISGHKDGLNRFNTQPLNRAYYNRRGLSQYNTSSSFISDYGSEGGIYSRLSQYDQFLDEYPYYEDSEDDLNELAIIATRSPIRDANGIDMVSLDKSSKTTAEMTGKNSSEQVFGGYNSRLPHKLGSYEKLRDSKVYKRTRQLVKDQKKLRQWPAGLELSGKGMTDEENVQPIKVGKDNESTGQPDENLVSENNRLPPLSENIAASPRSPTKMSFSSSFFSDYGLRSDRSDLFSGYKRGRKKAKSASETQLEKELQAKAERHIYACHVLSSIRRGSKAAQNYSSFRQEIGPSFRPSRPVSEISPPRPMHRHFNNSPDKSGHLYDTTKKSPVAFYIKTRDSSDLSKARMKGTDGLPEINGRTVLLGVVNK